MKNVMILSCATGQGHNSCAQAIREYFEEKNIRCDTVEALDFISPGFAKLVSWGHSFMYRRIPGLFRWGYRLSEDHPGMLESGSFIYGVLRSGAERMRASIAAGGYDTVICTHMFPALAMTELLNRGPMPVRTAFVATDYTLTPGTETCTMEDFFIPCPSLLDAYRARTKEYQRVIASGIPVRGVFWTRRDRDEAKRALGIAPEDRHLLVMCGSMGCGPIVKLLHRVAGMLPSGMEVTVICGTNESLREKLSRRYRDDRRVHVVGYTEEVSLYMDSADLYLTKPGGISVTEAAAKELPMAFVNPVSGCEKYNMDFYTDMGAAVTDPSLERLAQKCVRLLGSEGELERMRAALRAYGQPNGAKLIYEALMRA